MISYVSYNPGDGFRMSFNLHCVVDAALLLLIYLFFRLWLFAFFFETVVVKPETKETLCEAAGNGQN
jgi:hypothetical protein